MAIAVHTPRVLGWTLLGAMLAMCALSLAQAGECADLLRRLWGQPLAARGAIAADEWTDPLGRSGRALLREAIAQRPDLRGASVAAGAWRFAFALAGRIAPDARVYLNAPDLAAYLYASFFWYPAEVRAESRGAPIRDAASLAANGVFVEPAALAGLRGEGYSHAIARRPDGGLALLELPARGRRR
jgi:hypothetical protein